jgi:hypothetical protein
MDMSWILWAWGLAKTVYGWYKKIFTNDKPVEKVVTHEQPKVPISDGKSDDQKWKELGM